MSTIALIGCSSLKSEGSGIRARNLYQSSLFKKRVAHVERRELPWYVISAHYGLLKPEVQINDYDKALTSLDEIETAEWHLGVASQLMGELHYEFGDPPLKSVTIELHAGADYCEPLGAILSLLGMTIVKPVAKLPIGRQLQFYLG